MSSPSKMDPIVSGKKLSSLRVVDLKEELEKRGLSKSGSKKDLAERLRMNIQIELQRESQKNAADDEQLPNISMREQLADQNPFIRDYFQSQAELFHSQKVVKKLYEGMSHSAEQVVVQNLETKENAIASSSPQKPPPIATLPFIQVVQQQQQQQEVFGGNKVSTLQEPEVAQNLSMEGNVSKAFSPIIKVPPLIDTPPKEIEPEKSPPPLIAPSVPPPPQHEVEREKSPPPPQAEVRQESPPPPQEEVEPEKLQKVEPEKFQEVEPEKFQEVEPEKFQEVEPKKFQDVDPEKLQKVEPEKLQKVEPEKFQEVEPKKFHEMEPEKLQKIETEKFQEVEPEKSPSPLVTSSAPPPPQQKEEPEKISSLVTPSLVAPSPSQMKLGSDNIQEELDYGDDESRLKKEVLEHSVEVKGKTKRVAISPIREPSAVTPNEQPRAKKRRQDDYDPEENSQGQHDDDKVQQPSKSPDLKVKDPLQRNKRILSIMSEEMEEALDYGDEESTLKKEHDEISWTRRILKLKNRCAVIEKPDKKWNRGDRKPVVVTSNVLETIFPDVKLLPDSELKLEDKASVEHEKGSNSHHHQDRTHENDSSTEEKMDIQLEEPNIVNVKRKISIIPFEESVKELTPPRNPPSNILIITNLVRPFTLLQLKDMLQRTGTIADIWVDKIKSKCIAKFDKKEEAEETRAALHGIKWPSSNPKTLIVDYTNEEDYDDHRTKETGEKKIKVEKPSEAKGTIPVREWDLGKRERSRSRSVPGRRRRSGSERKRSRKSSSPHARRHSRSPHHDKKSLRDLESKEEAQGKALDELFRKTTTTPCIYWLPLTPDQISEKEEMRRKRMIERERRLAQIEMAKERQHIRPR